MTTLYMGNLSYTATEAELRSFVEFAGLGVSRVKICTDRETGKSRGFGFVDVDGDDVQAALSALDGQDFAGRELRVREAEQKPQRAQRPAPDRDRDLL